MIEKLLKNLEEVNKMHPYEGLAVMKAFKGAVYPFDLLAIAVLNRSMSLTSAFITLMRSNNFVASVTLIRPQLDTFLRFAAGWLVTDPHAFVDDILDGKPVKDIRTEKGQKMTDRFLVSHFSKEYPWISRVYENTSGYVHLSDKHMFVNAKNSDSIQGRVIFKISDKDDHIPENFKIEAIAAFAEITKLILHRVYSWRYTKENSLQLERKASTTT
jgi:hypothetical protein